MSPEQFRQAEAIFQSALNLAGDERARFVESACAGDGVVRAQVLALLDHDANPRVPLGSVVGDRVRRVSEALLGADGAPAAPARIGSYRLVRPLGEGGFGVVYLAEQENPRRLVAVKLLRAAFASSDVLRRFEYEALILARLQHPGIAQVFEAGAEEVRVGTVSGESVLVRQPFLAMEYVDGPNLIAYCAGSGTRPALSVNERLDLFARVCDAVQHAHQKGVIHRDLKPDNILVADTGSGPGPAAQPKVLDFGVARAVESDASLTAALTVSGRVLGTPAYMSPEQVAGESALVDTRSDVYSLGVILYQLLSGRLPYEVRSLPLAEVLRVVREQEPAPLGSIDRSLRGDASAVVEKALSKDRERRYASVAELGTDVRRLLAGEPVAAKRDSGWYVLRRAVRRHRVALAFGAVVAVMIAGSSIMGWSLYATEQKARRRETALLRESYLAEARATRAGGGAGRRFDALAALRKAAQIGFSPDLRDEAVACLVLPDLAPLCELPAGKLASAHGQTRIERVAIAEPGGPVRVFDAAGGREILTLQGRREAVFMRFSPRADYLGALDEGGELVVWSLADGREVLRIPRGAPRGFEFGDTGHGVWLALPDAPGRTRVLEIPSGATLGEFATSPRYFWMSADPSGTRLALSGEAGTPLEVFEVPGGQRLLSIETACDLRGPAWSPDGQLLGAGGGDFLVHVWDGSNGSPVRTLEGHRGKVSDVWFGPGGTLASWAWDGTTRLWDLRTGEALLAPIEGHDCVGFDGRLVLSSSRSVRVLRLADDRPVTVLEARDRLGPTSSVAFDGGARRLVGAGDCGVQVWDLSTGGVTTLTDRPSRSGFFVEGSGDIAAMVENRLVVWPAEHPGGGAPGARVVWTGTPGAWCSPHAGGRTAIVTDGDVLAVELSTGLARRIAAGHRGVERSSLTPDGAWLFAGTWRGESARVVEVATGNDALRIEAQSVRGALSADGSLLLAGVPGSYLVYRVGDWTSPRTLAVDESSLAGAGAFSPDGSLIGAVSLPYTVRLFATATGAPVASLPTPRRRGVTEIRFSPDGRLLAVATLEREIVVWRLDELRAALREYGFDW